MKKFWVYGGIFILVLSLYSGCNFNNKNVLLKRIEEIVAEANHPVEGVELDRHNEFLEIGESLTLNATVNPDNAANKELRE